ncbi:MAG TPA: hypothetical protein PLP01_06270 [Phycisphaerae bacterium]|nr:hypothetical protein [Phycisphaerae bacterium]
METCTSGSGLGPGRQCPGLHHHVGAAWVLLTEARGGYAHQLLAIGHLHEAEDESQEWPELHEAIHDARKAYQSTGQMPEFDLLSLLVERARRT